MKHRVTLLLLAALAALLLWSVGPLAASEGPLVFVGDKSYAPFEYLDEQGRPAGVFVDYWKLWAERSHVEHDYRLQPWSEALEAVQEGRAGVVGCIFYSKRRDKEFDFTRPYFTIANHLFLRRGSDGYTHLDDLRGKRVGVLADDLANEMLLKRAPGVELVAWPTSEALISAAVAGEVDSFVIAKQVAAFYLQRMGAQDAFLAEEEPLFVSRVHAAVREGDAATLALLERGMGQVPREELELLLAEHFGTAVQQAFPWRILLWTGGGVLVLGGLGLLWNRQLRRKVRSAVQALEHSERKFREVFDNSFQFMALLEPEGRVQRINKSALNRLPYEEQVTGRLFWDTPGLRENPHIHEPLQRAIAQAAAGELARLEEAMEDDRGQLYLDISIKPMRNERGEVELLIAEARDLTLRRKAEQELQAWRDSLQERVEERTAELSSAMESLKRRNEELEQVKEEVRASEEKYRLLVENAGEGIVVLQGNSLRYSNPKIEEISGYSSQELHGQPFIELVHPEDRAMVATNYQARLQGKEAPEQYDFRIINKRGDVRWLEITAVRFTWEGAQATLNLINDITERKQTEDAMLKAKRMAEDASRIMSDFVSMVSHELRTPMTSVLGFAKLILKDFERWFAKSAAQEPQLARRAHRIEENLRIIIDESDRLALLINDVLDLAKLESDKYDWHFEDASPEVLLEQALNATASLFMDKPVQTSFSVDAALPSVNCDRKSIVQVLVNLLANAAKFTDEGEVRLEAVKKGHEACISVCDTGCGVLPEEREHIFERFRQSGELLTDKPRGTGLGLSICKEIVEHHGGRIWAESTPGQGSCFRFTLPLVEDDVVDEAMLRG